MLETYDDMTLIANVHDSVFMNCPLDRIADRYDELEKIAIDVPGLRVPLSIDGKVSAKSWGTCVGVSCGAEVPAALEKSLTKDSRAWGHSA